MTTSKLSLNLLVMKKLLANASKYAYNKMAKMAYYWTVLLGCEQCIFLRNVNIRYFLSQKMSFRLCEPKKKEKIVRQADLQSIPPCSRPHAQHSFANLVIHTSPHLLLKAVISELCLVILR